MKKIILLFFAFIINAVFSLSAFAENFYITNYYVDLKVQKNRDVLITENIGVFFTNPSHGIFRNIPTKTTLYYENGKKSQLKAKIYDVEVNEAFSIHKDNKSTTFKIGNPYKLVNGQKNYQIKYTYSLGNDKIKNADEFYFNIIGTQWNTYINDVQFRIVLPTPYSGLSKTTGFSLGKIDTSGYDPDYLKYAISNDSTIVGKVIRRLAPNEGLTVRLTLPENYFTKQIDFSNETYILALMSLLTLISFIMWFIFGKDEKVIPVVNFYPPKNKNSAEVGVEYRGLASHKEIVSLIMYLGNKGYLEIEDDGVSFTLHKLKDYDGKNSCERRLMSVLFKSSDTVTAEDLQSSRSFYRNCESLIAALNNIRKFIFDKNACSIEKILLLLVCIVGLFASMLYVVGDYSFSVLSQSESFVLLFPVLGSLAVAFFTYNIIMSKESIAVKIPKIFFIVIWGSMFIGIPLFFIIPQVFDGIAEHLPILIYGGICLLISFVCLANMPKRNKNGRLLLGQIEGFKKFLEVAEKRRIESLIAENKSYGSDILPFAYVLDVSDKILPVLENISLYSQPTWYKGRLSNHSFSNFTTALEKATMPSVENGGIRRSSGSSGGRGFSGGGSSGRGGGGGGGGSW